MRGLASRQPLGQERGLAPAPPTRQDDPAIDAVVHEQLIEHREHGLPSHEPLMQLFDTVVHTPSTMIRYDSR